MNKKDTSTTTMQLQTDARSTNLACRHPCMHKLSTNTDHDTGKPSPHTQILCYVGKQPRTKAIGSSSAPKELGVFLNKACHSSFEKRILQAQGHALQASSSSEVTLTSADAGCWCLNRALLDLFSEPRRIVPQPKSNMCSIQGPARMQTCEIT